MYRNYSYDSSTDDYEDTGVLYAVSIVGKEDIFGNTYYKFKTLTTGNETMSCSICNENGERIRYYREYEGKFVTSNGFVAFTNNDYSDRVLSEHSWGTVMETLIKGEIDLTVEAGTFTSINL